MARVIQVGAGSGGIAVLDAIGRDPRITQITLIEPDVYKPHNVVRHIFPPSAAGKPKGELAKAWLAERRPDLIVQVFTEDLMGAAFQNELEQIASQADVGVCAVDNEPAKYHFDAIMRRHGKPWTLGEVLSGGIGGFVHWFTPGGPCYGCVASHLKRVEESGTKGAQDNPRLSPLSPSPDYSNPQGALTETTVPAGKASIQAIASLHAVLTLRMLEWVRSQKSEVSSQRSDDGAPAADLCPLTSDLSDLGFTSLLLPLERVPGVFEEPFRPYRFRIARLAECLICQPDLGDEARMGDGEKGRMGESRTQANSPPLPSSPSPILPLSPEQLDVALDRALARLGNE